MEFRTYDHLFYFLFILGDQTLTFDHYIGRMDKEYFCEICQIFKHKSKHTVRTHVEGRHFPNTFSYICQLCDQSCSSRKALENHMQKHRKNEINF